MKENRKEVVETIVVEIWTRLVVMKMTRSAHILGFFKAKNMC